MSRRKQAELTAWRERIYTQHVLRSQAEPRLSIKRLWLLCDGQLSARTIRRHLEWLREHGYLAR